MGRTYAVLAAVLVVWSSLAAAQDAGDRQALARQIQQQFAVLPVQGGVVLTPRDASRGIQSIELTGGAIAIDGEPVTGAELRQRLAADADAVLRLSYLDGAEQRALFSAQPAPPASPAPPTPPAIPEPEPTPDPSPRPGGRNADRVRIGGGVEVRADEVITGDVVAIGGGANVDGRVFGDVVAIGGNLELGPTADVEGDVVVVGGTLRRNPSARIGGEVQEVSFGDMDFGPGGWWRWHMPGAFFGPAVGSLFALASTTARLVVLCFLASIVLLFARGYVERVGVRAANEPVKAGLVGLLIQLLFLPALIATIVVLVVTIIGIPLLLLVPFALLAFAVFCLVGFTAVVYDVGRLAGARFGLGGQNPYVIAAIGTAAVLSPVLASRFVGFGGSLISPIAWTLLILGVLVEYVVWTIGLGAVTLVRFDRKAGQAA